MTKAETYPGREGVVLGAMYFGTRVDEATSFALLDRVRIATKVRHRPTVPHRLPESTEGLSAAAIRAGVEESRKRLGAGVRARLDDPALG